MFAFYRCRTQECDVRITVDTQKDLITDVHGEHLHENELLGSLVKAKVDEVKKQAIYGAYSKPRAGWWGVTSIGTKSLFFILVIFINLLLFSGPEQEHAEAQVDRGVQQRPRGAGLVQENLVLVNGAAQGHRSNMGEDQ